jgi:hypothetical protein
LRGQCRNFTGFPILCNLSEDSSTSPGQPILDLLFFWIANDIFRRKSALAWQKTMATLTQDDTPMPQLLVNRIGPVARFCKLQARRTG